MACAAGALPWTSAKGRYLTSPLHKEGGTRWDGLIGRGTGCSRYEIVETEILR